MILKTKKYSLAQIEDAFDKIAITIEELCTKRGVVMNIKVFEDVTQMKPVFLSLLQYGEY